MLKSVVVLGALILGLQPAEPVQSSVASFAVEVETLPNGWAARCDSGCNWRELAFRCASACDAILDADGLVTVAMPRSPSAFRFILVRTSDGIEAHSRGGTAWSRLAWSCSSTAPGTTPCRAVVTGNGVGALPIRR